MTSWYHPIPNHTTPQNHHAGFAPNLSYHILSSGSKGSLISERGLPGTSSGYIVYGGPTNALSGDYGFGGKGTSTVQTVKKVAEVVEVQEFTYICVDRVVIIYGTVPVLVQ